MVDPSSCVWSQIPRVLFFAPEEQKLTPESGKSSPAPSDCSNSSFETVENLEDDAFEPVTGIEVNGGLFDEGLLTGKPSVRWPIIECPEEGPLKTVFMPYHNHDSWPMLTISVSNVFLQIALNIRDLVLSCDSKTLSGDLKLGVVTVLSIGTAIGYTICTVKEASIRFVAAVIAIVLAVLFTLIAFIFSTEDSTESIFLPPIRLSETFGAIQVTSAVQCLTQVGAGILGAYEMMTNQNPNMPRVQELTNQATLGLQNLFIVNIISDLADDLVNQYLN